MSAPPFRFALAFALALAAGCAQQPQRPNVLLVVVDTLRADRLGSAAGGRAVTPNVDALAAEGLCFTHAQSPRAKTTPAVATLLTGLYPHDHGVRDLVTPLDERVPLLPEHLRAHGWSTGAIVGNFVLQDALSGLARGFELWVEDLPDVRGVPPDGVEQRTARSLSDGALRALGLGAKSADGAGPERALVRPGRPWFLWLHYMDPHGLYDPPAEHLSFTDGAPRPVARSEEALAGATHQQVVAEYNVLPEDRLPDGRADAARVIDRYDGEARYADAELGRLLERMRAAGLLDETIVVFVADHGESLGEHDYWFEHGRYAYEATCRVPLVLWFGPGLRDRPPAGVRRGDVSLADLAPTLCEVLGVPRFPALPPGGRGGPAGASFTPLFRSDRPRERAVFSEKVDRAELSGAVQAKAVRVGDWKLIRRYTHVLDPVDPTQRRLSVLSEELYDLAADPGETRDLSAAPPDAAPLDLLRAELFAFAKADVHFEDLARWLQERREQLGREDPRTLRVLESLGY